MNKCESETDVAGYSSNVNSVVPYKYNTHSCWESCGRTHQQNSHIAGMRGTESSFHLEVSPGNIQTVRY